MRRLLLLLSIFLALSATPSGSAFAAPVNGDQARIVAENYLRHVVATFNRWNGDLPSIRSISPVLYNDANVFWHVQLEPTGYLLVSSRDELSPVKVYSEDGVFDPARVNTPHAPESWIIPEQYHSIAAVSDPVKKARLTPDDSVVRSID